MDIGRRVLRLHRRRLILRPGVGRPRVHRRREGGRDLRAVVPHEAVVALARVDVGAYLKQ